MSLITRINRALERNSLSAWTGNLSDYEDCIEDIIHSVDRKILQRPVDWLAKLIAYNPPSCILDLSVRYVNASASAKRGHTYDSFILRYGNVDIAEQKYNDRCNAVSNGVNSFYDTASEREKRSRIVGCYEFYEDRYGDDAKAYYDEYLEKRSKLSKQAIKKTHHVLRTEHHRCAVKYEYWLHKCNGNHTLAKALYKQRQGTGSLESFTKRHGSREGYRLWRARQRKWVNSLQSKSDEAIGAMNDKKYRNSKSPSNISNASVNLFDALKEVIQLDMIYGGKDVELSIKYDAHHRYYYDCFIPAYNLIIEYHGTLFHPKPLDRKWYNRLSSICYNVARLKDLKKKNVALSAGYRFIEVWSDKANDENIATILNFIEDIKHNDQIRTPKIHLPG